MLQSFCSQEAPAVVDSPVQRPGEEDKERSAWSDVMCFWPVFREGHRGIAVLLIKTLYMGGQGKPSLEAPGSGGCIPHGDSPLSGNPPGHTSKRVNLEVKNYQLLGTGVSCGKNTSAASTDVLGWERMLLLRHRRV